MAKKKDELIEDAIKLKIELDGSETIPILEEKIKVAESDVSNLPFEAIVERIEIHEDNIAKKKSRNATLEQLNRNRNSEIEIIKRKTILKQTKEDKDGIKEKNKIITENNRQISKNLAEIMEMETCKNELEREKGVRIPEIINSYAIDYIKAKCAKDYICDEIITKVTELITKQKELELIEMDKRNEFNSALAKYNVGDISADMIALENDLDVDKTKLSQKLRSYVRSYSKKLTQFRKKV